jgi:hypothetical protein
MKTHHNQSSNLNPAGFRSAMHLGNRGRGQLPRIDFRLRHQNRALATEKLLELLKREAPRFWELSAVVGKWVWVAFDGRQPKQVTMLLAQFGFHWSRRRQCWQHPCGKFSDAISPRDPREKYGSYYAADQSHA